MRPKRQDTGVARQRHSDRRMPTGVRCYGGAIDVDFNRVVDTKREDDIIGGATVADQGGTGDGVIKA